MSIHVHCVVSLQLIVTWIKATVRLRLPAVLCIDLPPATNSAWENALYVVKWANEYNQEKEEMHEGVRKAGTMTGMRKNETEVKRPHCHFWNVLWPEYRKVTIL